MQWFGKILQWFRSSSNNNDRGHFGEIAGAFYASKRVPESLLLLMAIGGGSVELAALEARLARESLASALAARGSLLALAAALFCLPAPLPAWPVAAVAGAAGIHALRELRRRAAAHSFLFGHMLKRGRIARAAAYAHMRRSNTFPLELVLGFGLFAVGRRLAGPAAAYAWPWWLLDSGAIAVWTAASTSALALYLAGVARMARAHGLLPPPIGRDVALAAGLLLAVGVAMVAL